MKMTRDDPNNDVDTRRKVYDISAFEDLDYSPVFVNPAWRDINHSNAKERTNSSCSIFQCRYVVTLFGIFVYFELDSYRINTSMSLVKMVNRTLINAKKNFNNTVDSCPFNNSAIQELPYPVVGGEFNWSPEIQGYILSAGFLGYVVSQIPGGMLAETYGGKVTLFSGLLLSSLAHMLCPFAAWFNGYLMIAMQFLRGVGQGFLPPASSVIAAKWFPRPERGFLNSLIFSGYGVGSFITYSTSGALCSSTLFGGWPLVFFVYGGLGLTLGLCVHLFLYESPKEHPRIGKAELIYILQNQECDLSQKNGMLNSIPYVFQILLIYLGGWVSKWLNTHGYIGVDRARKGCTMLYSLGYSLALLGMYFAGCDRVWSNVCSIIAFSFIGISVPGCMVVPSDMSPTFAGSLFAFSNTLASSASFIFPIIVGAMIDVEESLEQWKKIFLLCIAVIMSSGVLFCLFGSAEVQPWNFQSTEVDERNSPKDEVVKSENKESTISKEISIHL